MRVQHWPRSSTLLRPLLGYCFLFLKGVVPFEEVSCGETACRWFEDCDSDTTTCVTKDVCIASETSCTFYPDCLEAAFPCGKETGYALGAGQPACRGIAAKEDGFSAAAKKWSLKTRKCLQQALLVDKQVADLTAMTCEEMSDFAISTHATCYKDSGFCDLRFRDYLKITNSLEGLDLNIPKEREDKSTRELLDACLPSKVLCRSIACFLIRAFFRSLRDRLIFWN